MGQIPTLKILRGAPLQKDKSPHPSGIFLFQAAPQDNGAFSQCNGIDMRRGDFPRSGVPNVADPRRNLLAVNVDGIMPFLWVGCFKRDAYTAMEGISTFSPSCTLTPPQRSSYSAGRLARWIDPRLAKRRRFPHDAWATPREFPWPMVADGRVAGRLDFRMISSVCRDLRDMLRQVRRTVNRILYQQLP